MSKKKRTKRPEFRKLFEFILIVLTTILLVVIATYSIQISKGIAKEVGSPAYTLRIEILNAGAENGLENELADYLQGIDSHDMDLDIVKTSKFTLQPSKESFIIIRTKDKDRFMKLAELLKIEKIQHSELKQNKNHLDATIVIGNDFVIDALLDKSEELE